MMDALGIGLQLLVNVFAIVGGSLGIIAFMDIRRKRYKLKINSGIGFARYVEGANGAQVPQDGPIIEISLINSGMVTMYPLSFHILVNRSQKISFSPKKPYDVLLSGRSIRSQLGKSWIYEELKKQAPAELEKTWVSLQVVVKLEDDLVCKSNTLKLRVASLESADPTTQSRIG